MKKLILLPFLATILFFSGCVSNPLGGNSDKIRLYIAENRELEFEPCGCSLSPRGGLRREYNFIQKNGRASASISFGRTFVREAGKKPDNIRMNLLKAGYLVKGLKEVGLTHVFPDTEDLTLGVKQLEGLASQGGFSLYSANIVKAGTSETVWKPFAVIGKSSDRVAVLGLANPESPKVAGFVIENYETALRRFVPKALSEAPMIIVLGGFTPEERVALAARFPEVSLFVGQKTEPDHPVFEQYNPQTAFAAGRFRSQDILNLEVTPRAGAKTLYSARLNKVVRDTQTLWGFAVKSLEEDYRTAKTASARKEIENRISYRKEYLARTVDVPKVTADKSHGLEGQYEVLSSAWAEPANAMDKLIQEVNEKVRVSAIKADE